MKVITLARVSTEEQKEAGNSLPSQIDRLNNYLRKAELEPWKEFSFDESAWKQNREEFSKVLKLVKDSPEPVAICCDKIDRLIRNFTHDLADLEELRRVGKIELHFPSDNIVLTKDSPATDLFRFTIGVSLAKYYSDAISDNVKRAQEKILRNGFFPGKAYFGYNNIKLSDDNDRKNWIEPDPFKSQIVLELFTLYASGAYSMELLAKKVKEKYGVVLGVGHIQRMFTNKFYVGTMTWDGKEYPHVYDCFISRELFDNVQAVRLGHNKKNFKYAGKPYDYRGMIRCGHCGCMITPEKKKGKYVYYHCTEYKGKHGAEWIREEEITDQLATMFEGMIIPQRELGVIVSELKAAHDNKSHTYRKLLDSHKTEIQKYENRIEKMYEDYLDGSITKDLYERKRKEYRDKQEDLTFKVQQLQQADESYYITTSYLVELAARAAELFKSSKAEQKRQLLKLTLQNLRLEGKTVKYDLEYPFDVIFQHVDGTLGCAQ